jgi:hypothetical protein
VATRNMAAGSLSRQGTVPALRPVQWLVGAYLVLSMLTVAAMAVLSDVAPSLVSSTAWGRGIIVAATSVLTFVFASRAAKGNSRALPASASPSRSSSSRSAPCWCSCPCRSG